VKLRLWRKYKFKPGDRVVTWSRVFGGYHGTLVRKSRLPWSWLVEFDSDHVPGGKRQVTPQANLIPEELAPERGIDDLFYRHFRKRR